MHIYFHIRESTNKIDMHAYIHGRWQLGSWPPWIFTHGTDTVDRGLIVLFFGLFWLFFGLFFRWPPWKVFCRRPRYVYCI